MSSWHQNVTRDSEGHRWEGRGHGGHRPAMCRAGWGVVAPRPTQLAESHLGEAGRGQQDLGALPSGAQPAAQRTVPPNHSFGLTCLGWPPSPSCFLSPGGPWAPPHLPVRGPCLSGPSWALGKAGRGGGKPIQQTRHGTLRTRLRLAGGHLQGRTERGVFTPAGPRQEQKWDRTQGRNESHDWKCAWGKQALSDPFTHGSWGAIWSPSGHSPPGARAGPSGFTVT